MSPKTQEESEMKKMVKRPIAALQAFFTSKQRRERVDHFIAWLAGTNHERSMNG